MSNFTSRRAPRKPSKDFPLSVHKGTGYWCKKVRGHVHYFGKVADDPKGQAALQLWLEQKDDLLAGREPRARKDEATVADVCNEFLTHQEGRRDAGEITARTFWQLHATCAILCDVLGKTRVVSDLAPADFGKLKSKLGKKRGPTALSNEMQRCRSVFLFAHRNGLIPNEVRYGTKFNKPPRKQARKVRRLHREQHGDRMFEAAEVRLILDAVDGKEVTLDHTDVQTGQPVKVKLRRNPALRAMVLLAINGGLGQSDLSGMPQSVVDLKNALITYPRPKTEADRLVPLWQETVEAIRDWLPHRPKAKDHTDSGLLFVTRFGGRFVRTGTKGGGIDGIAQEFNKVLRRLGLARAGRGFYGLRHSFRTIADETLDATATDLIMGHVDESMAGHYRERIGKDRLRRVVEHVRAWLFAPPATSPGTAPPASIHSVHSIQQPASTKPAARTQVRKVRKTKGLNPPPTAAGERPAFRIVG